jgi:putative transcription antitermination factor YqgF
MTPIVRRFGKTLQEKYPNIALVYQDERNSTVEAAAMLHEVGQNAKKQRKRIDSAAAMVILERYLQSQETYEDLDDEI